MPSRANSPGTVFTCPHQNSVPRWTLGICRTQDGTRWTVGDAYGGSLEPAMAAISAEYGVQFLGIVAAEVVVPDASVLRVIESQPEVWLVDLSIEQVGRSRADLDDIGQNDLYWRLAGWD